MANEAEAADHLRTITDPWIEHARRLQSLCWQTTGAVARYLEEHFVPKEAHDGRDRRNAQGDR